MNTPKHRELVDVDTIAKLTRLHPESVRRKCRRKEMPFIRDGYEYQFDVVEVFEHFVKQDIIETLQGYLDDPALPKVIRSNITTMRDGVRDGWLSIEKCSELMHAMEA